MGVGGVQKDGQNCLGSQRKIWSKLWKSCFHLLPSSHQNHWTMDLPMWSIPVPIGLRLCQPKGAPLWQDWHAQKWHSIFACPGLGNTSDFLVSLPSLQWANPEPRHLKLCLCKALKEPVQALRIGRRAQLKSRTASRWDIRSCACHTRYTLPCGHTPAEHSQWVSPCRSYTGSPPVWVALLPLYKHRAEGTVRSV